MFVAIMIKLICYITVLTVLIPAIDIAHADWLRTRNALRFSAFGISIDSVSCTTFSDHVFFADNTSLPVRAFGKIVFRLSDYSRENILCKTNYVKYSGKYYLYTLVHIVT